MIPSAATFVAWGSGLGGFVAAFTGAAYGVWRKVRNQAAHSAKNDHEDLQKKIKAAVTEDRKSQGEALTVMKDAMIAYKELAGVRTAQNQELAERFEKLNTEFKKLKKENSALRQANADMTVELQDMKQRLEQLTVLVKSLPQNAVGV